MPLLTLKDLEHLKTNKMVAFKPETINDLDVIIVTYMVADADFWKQKNAHELRGHTFDASSGKLISAAFEKFFNIGEKDETQIHKLNFKNAQFFEKVDASMLNTLVHDGKVYLKTKKSFYSEVAISATKNVTQNVLDLTLAIRELGYSSILEYYHPDWKVVMNYGKTPQFTTLAARSLNDLSYMKYEDLQRLCDKFGVNVVKRYNTTIAQVMTEVDTVKNREGYVILLENGVRVKQKFDWYRVNHRVQTELRERDVALMVAMETIDDVKARLREEGYDLTQIELVESRVVKELTTLQSDIDSCVAECVGLNPMQVAAKYKNHELRGLIMRKYKGQPFDLVDYWRKNYLKSYSLSCVYNNKW